MTRCEGGGVPLCLTRTSSSILLAWFTKMDKLKGVIQTIHTSEETPPFVLTSEVDERWTIKVYGNISGSLQIWETQQDIPDTKKVSLISEAITDGNLHLDLPSSKSQALTLHIFLSNEQSLIFHLQLNEGQNAGMELLGIIGTILQRKPQEPKDVDKLRDEIRMLKVSLAEKDKTINTYQSKITALEGKLVRASPKKPKTGKL
ncbi:hypothetical protein TREMEDRAFT_63097 [Tremella mesenterica DSM 1558]|uniref:uncharacterized protein n=1 Tax=Tremella mesenterica (strain ATCC 24925 / CBS 8224 / DSM 1558 / NBRC 9311 / NRRL Y-6157 / RJB 2259-6 / UBC 559-6) TaxID=578456 RepID=UPI0003F49951|nr:uncharacterized protein TREMEDRAFT_63097 [Tremella mesenterica DSM 1558]EIW68630.1 hypothetical protein TREMEDRAFT_63097 [Tremella mesenterica DSM 1558]